MTGSASASGLDDADRILVFRCTPIVDLANGEVVLPARITCYCRHHHEKTGFQYAAGGRPCVRRMRVR